MQSKWKIYIVYVSLMIIGGGILLILVETVRANNTGFETKTLWDWMDLLIIPLVLAIGAFFLNRSERAIERQMANGRAELEREIAKDRQQEASLQAYLNQMSELILREKLRTTDIPEVRDVARTRTISVMRGLDSKRNDLVVQFLREAKLVVDENSILNNSDMDEMNLEGLNLNGLYLQRANLEKANLEATSLTGANLTEAHLGLANLQKADLADAKLSGAVLKSAKLMLAYLHGADLTGAQLKWTNFQDANLENANLQDANLHYAILTGAYLAGANLTGAYLDQADLEGANLERANVTTEQLAIAKSLKDVTMADGTKHE